MVWRGRSTRQPSRVGKVSAIPVVWLVWVGLLVSLLVRLVLLVLLGAGEAGVLVEVYTADVGARWVVGRGWVGQVVCTVPPIEYNLVLGRPERVVVVGRGLEDGGGWLDVKLIMLIPEVSGRRAI